MARVQIPNIAWRDGKPRFHPSRHITAIGFKSHNLQHADGAWFSLDETEAWAAEMQVMIQERRTALATAKAAGKRPPALLAKASTPRRSAGITIAELFDSYFRDSPRMNSKGVAIGKRVHHAASPATVRDYKQKARALENFDQAIYTASVEALSKVILYDLYERLWQVKGLATARGVIATLGAAIAWGMQRGRVKLDINPCHNLQMKMPEARLRCGTPEEMRALVAAADAIGRPEIGDAIIMGLWTGQRQNDRLQLVDAGLMDGRRLYRQSKTGAIVEIKQAPELEARIAASRQRRADWKVQPLHMIVDEQTRQPFKPDHYRHTFAKVREHAALTTPSLSDFRDQDLRDTAVTWLARASCTLMEICQITGHSHASAQLILRHYLSQHREMGDAAIAKLMTWYATQDSTRT